MEIILDFNMIKYYTDSVKINMFFGAGCDSPPAVTVRDLPLAADLVKSQNRQYSLDERRNCTDAGKTGSI